MNWQFLYREVEGDCVRSRGTNGVPGAGTNGVVGSCRRGLDSVVGLATADKFISNSTVDIGCWNKCSNWAGRWDCSGYTRGMGVLVNTNIGTIGAANTLGGSQQTGTNSQHNWRAATRWSSSATRWSSSATRWSGSATRWSGSATRWSGSATRWSGSATRWSSAASDNKSWWWRTSGYHLPPVMA